MKALKILSAAVLMAAAGVANASSYSVTADSLLNKTDFNTPLTLNLFDSHNGHWALDSVNVKLDGLLSSIGTVTNTSSSTVSFTVSLNSKASLTQASGNTPTELNSALGAFNLSLQVGEHYSNIGTSNATQSFAEPGFKPLQNQMSTTLSFAPGADWLATTPNDSFTLLFKTLTNQAITGKGGNIHTKLTTKAEGIVTVEYNYHVVPVPGSLSLLASGLFGVVAFNRRKRLNVA